MSWRTFGQSLLLILFGGFVFWATASILGWQARRAYEGRSADAAASYANMSDDELMGNDVLTVDAANAGRAVPSSHADSNAEIGRENFQGE